MPSLCSFASERVKNRNVIKFGKNYTPRHCHTGSVTCFWSFRLVFLLARTRGYTNHLCLYSPFIVVLGHRKIFPFEQDETTLGQMTREDPESTPEEHGKRRFSLVPMKLSITEGVNLLLLTSVRIL